MLFIYNCKNITFIYVRQDIAFDINGQFLRISFIDFITFLLRTLIVIIKCKIHELDLKVRVILIFTY